MDSKNPYLPPEVNLDTQPALLHYVGFWSRAVAVIVDSILMALLLWPFLYALYGSEYYTGDQLLYGPMDFILSYVLPAVAVVLFWIYKSATPGKMLVHAKIVDADSGEPASKKQLIIRYLGYYLSGLVLMLGFIWVAIDPRKQGWHDKLANTLVVRTH
jgi:uncharacterized RDD family membrane protein YckC